MYGLKSKPHSTALNYEICIKLELFSFHLLDLQLLDTSTLEGQALKFNPLVI